MEIHGIQMLRAFAALAVVCHHALEHSDGAIGRFSPDWLTTCGAAGVDVFFVISGFIMFYVSFGSGRAPPTPAAFLVRRLTRIYPFYWLCSLALLLICAIGFLASVRLTPALVVSSFLLLPGGKLLGVAWTLVYEIYFYLIFAAMLWFRSAHVAIGGSVMAIGSILLLVNILPGGDAVRFLASPLPIEFCLGLALAYAYTACVGRTRAWPFTLPVTVLGTGLVVVAPLLVAHPDTSGLPPLPRVLAWGLPAALIVAGVLGIGKPRGSVMRFWLLLGNASYALYLTHVFVMIGYGRLIKIEAFSRISQVALVPLVVVIAAAVGIAAHLLVEQPLLRGMRRLGESHGLSGRRKASAHLGDSPATTAP